MSDTDLDRAIETIYAEHWHRLLRLVTARTRDSDLAEDLAQEAFVRLTIAARAQGLPDDPLAWLARVTRNLLVSDARRRSTARRRGMDLRRDALTERSAEDDFLGRADTIALRVALEGLPPSQRTTLLLAESGVRAVELERRTGRSAVAYRGRLFRARAALRAALEDGAVPGVAVGAVGSPASG